MLDQTLTRLIFTQVVEVDEIKSPISRQEILFPTIDKKTNKYASLDAIDVGAAKAPRLQSQE